MQKPETFRTPYLHRFAELQLVEADSHLADDVVVRVPVVVEHLQHQLLTVQLVARHGELEVLVEERVRVAAMDARLALAPVHLRVERQPHVRVTEAALLYRAEVVRCERIHCVE